MPSPPKGTHGRPARPGVAVGADRGPGPFLGGEGQSDARESQRQDPKRGMQYSVVPPSPAPDNLPRERRTALSPWATVGGKQGQGSPEWPPKAPGCSKPRSPRPRPRPSPAPSGCCCYDRLRTAAPARPLIPASVASKSRRAPRGRWDTDLGRLQPQPPRPQ